MPELSLEQGNVLSNVIRLSHNLASVATDGIDGYATIQQAKQEIIRYAKEIEAKISEL